MPKDLFKTQGSKTLFTSLNPENLFSLRITYTSYQQHSPGWFSSQPPKVRVVLFVWWLLLTMALDIAVDGMKSSLYFMAF